MADPNDSRPTPLGIYDRPSRPVISGVEIIALALSALWLIGAATFFLLLEPPAPEIAGPATGTDRLRFVMTLLAVFIAGGDDLGRGDGGARVKGHARGKLSVTGGDRRDPPGLCRPGAGPGRDERRLGAEKARRDRGGAEKDRNRAGDISFLARATGPLCRPRQSTRPRIIRRRCRWARGSRT